MTDHREFIEWCDVWIAGAQKDELPRILLIGDSIVKSYYPHVRKGLQGQYQCGRLCSSKCVSDSRFMNELALVLDDRYHFDVIHFNNGLHGWDYSEEEYEIGLEKAFDKLLSYSGKVIFGNTTPMRDREDPSKLHEKTARVQLRNQIAEKLAADRQIPVTDLYSTVIDHPAFFEQDGVHFNEDGQQALADKVLEAVAALNER